MKWHGFLFIFVKPNKQPNQPMSNFLPLQQLSESLEGDLLYDELHKKLYATDASAYRIIPEAVAIPKSVEDIIKIIRFASENNISITPRTAGTSLAGETVGNGIIVDVSDFYKKEPCRKWKDLRKAYYKIYKPTLYRFPIRIPYFVLNVIRIGYRYYRKLKFSINKGKK